MVGEDICITDVLWVAIGRDTEAAVGSKKSNRVKKASKCDQFWHASGSYLKLRADLPGK
jgi:hypothetical protein